MDFPRNRYSKHAKLVVSFAVNLLLWPGILHGAEDITMELMPPKAVRGEQVKIIIQTHLPWDENVEIDRPLLNGALTWWAYPYARPWVGKNPDDNHTRMIEVRAAVRVDEPGFHSIDPFRIRAGTIEVSTEIGNIIGIDQDEHDVPYPVFVQWRSPPLTVWQWQTVPLILDAQNLSHLALASSTALNQIPTGLLEEASGYGRIITHPYREDILYDVPMASWLWTLDEPGRFQFPGVRVEVNGLIRTSPGFSLEVKPLPAQAHQSGAVGRFQIDATWEKKIYTVDEILSIRVRVDGRGNLSVLRAPIPEVSGLELVSSGSLSSFLPDSMGYEGWREDRYDYRIDAAGKLGVKIPEWTWFDPQHQGRLYSIGEQSYIIEVEEASLAENPFSSAEMLLGADFLRYPALRFHGKNFPLYLLALSSLLVLAGVWMYRHFKLRYLSVALILPLLLSAIDGKLADVEMASKAKTHALSGAWHETERIYADLSERYGDSPGLLHDRAITAMETGRSDIAITLIRRSLFLRPGNRLLTQTHEYIENRLGLPDQVDIPLTWPPSIVFVLWLLGANGMVLLSARLIHRRDSRMYIACVAGVVFFVISSFALATSTIIWHTETGVVNTDAQILRKIPDPMASEWIKLPVGSAVKVMVVNDQKCLIRTGYGMEGWLPLDSLYLVENVSDGL